MIRWRGRPNPDLAVPAVIRNVAGEPVVLLCHAPDYIDFMLRYAGGRAVDFVLSGHTHGGQVRLPLIGADAVADAGQEIHPGPLSVWEVAALRQSRPGHGWHSVPVRLPTGDYAAHAVTGVSPIIPNFGKVCLIRRHGSEAGNAVHHRRKQDGHRSTSAGPAVIPLCQQRVAEEAAHLQEGVPGSGLNLT